MYLNPMDSTSVTGQSTWLLLQHRSGTWTVHEPSTVQENCPNHLSVPVTRHVWRKGEQSLQYKFTVWSPRRWQISWCFSRTDGLSQGNEGSRGTLSWGKPRNSTFVATMSKCSFALLQVFPQAKLTPGNFQRSAQKCCCSVTSA